jgi:mannose-6-phosphate isomerase-like protein (cupin superfamily)
LIGLWLRANRKLNAINDYERDSVPTPKKVVLADAFSKFTETWSPRVGGEINDFQIKLAKLEGEFHWHHHENEDELFLVITGKLRIKLSESDGEDVVLNPGEFLVVPRGIEHCPIAEPACEVVLLERNTTLNTGNVENDRTVRHLSHI